MDRAQIKTTFDRQAPTYDQQWSKLGAIRDCLQLLLGSVFATLSAEARILCVGAGTGAEIQHLASLFPGWTFTAVEPSPAMLSACRERAEANGYAQRCRFHEGYLDSLPAGEPFDAATCFLVSQFILARRERAASLRAIVLARATWRTTPDHSAMVRPSWERVPRAKARRPVTCNGSPVASSGGPMRPASRNSTAMLTVMAKLELGPPTAAPTPASP